MHQLTRITIINASQEKKEKGKKIEQLRAETIYNWNIDFTKGGLGASFKGTPCVEMGFLSSAMQDSWKNGRMGGLRAKSANGALAVQRNWCVIDLYL